MVGSEGAVEPGSPVALHRGLLVVEAVVAEDLRLRLVGGPDQRAPMNPAMRLVKVHRSRDVIWDDVVMLPRLGDAVDLHRQKHRNASMIQFASQQDYGGPSPTVAEEDDVSLGFFLVAQQAVPIAVEQAKDGLVSSSAVSVLEDADVGILGKIVSSALRELHWTLVWIVVPNESAHKADQDVRRRHRGAFDDAAVRCTEEGHGEKDRKGHNETSKSRETGHAGLPTLRFQMFALLPGLRKIRLQAASPSCVRASCVRVKTKSRFQQGFWTIRTRWTVYTRLSRGRGLFGPETNGLPDTM
jgi:hypothetical protein